MPDLQTRKLEILSLEFGDQTQRCDRSHLDLGLKVLELFQVTEDVLTSASWRLLSSGSRQQMSAQLLGPAANLATLVLIAVLGHDLCPSC